MKELPQRIHDDTNGLDYVLVGDYYIPALRLTEESRPIGHWGRRRKAYLEEARPLLQPAVIRETLDAPCRCERTGGGTA